MKVYSDNKSAVQGSFSGIYERADFMMLMLAFLAGGVMGGILGFILAYVLLYDDANGGKDDDGDDYI